MTKHSDAWVCVDCYFAHHYGATETLLEGFELADNTFPEGDDPDDPGETGEQEFSWRSCEGCGSTLGGSRYRLAVFGVGVSA